MIVKGAVNFDSCLEIAAGRFFTPGDKEVRMGLKIALGDLDPKEKGVGNFGNFGNFHHEGWFAGEKNKRTNLRQWGTLRLMAGDKMTKSE